MNTPKAQSHIVEELVEPVNRHVHDPIARGIVTFLKETSVTPNQVTYASIFTGLVAAFAFSRGPGLSMILAGVLLESVLILDCVDGQLARAKGCSSEWGRLLDGVAGYISYLAVLIGITAGTKGYGSALLVIGCVTILKAISYDYVKLDMIARIQKGCDGHRRERVDTAQKFRDNPSAILKIYFYYLKVQAFIFRGQRVSLEDKEGDEADAKVWTPDQREEFRTQAKTLMAVWSWNGADLPLFLLAITAILGVLEPVLIPLAYFLTAQYLMTMVYHRLKPITN